MPRLSTAPLSKPTAVPLADKGDDTQATGRSRGGRTTKSPVRTTSRCAPIAFRITAGQKGGGPVGPGPLWVVAPSIYLLADTAYDSDAVYLSLLGHGTVAVIPQHSRRTTSHPFGKAIYKRQNIVEQTFSRLKDWRRVATRYDRLKHTVQSTVAIAIICSW